MDNQEQARRDAIDRASCELFDKFGWSIGYNAVACVFDAGVEHTRSAARDVEDEVKQRVGEMVGYLRREAEDVGVSDAFKEWVLRCTEVCDTFITAAKPDAPTGEKR